MFPKATEIKYHYNILGCVHLGAAEIGKALVDGSWKWISWGRNLSLDQAEQYKSLGLNCVNVNDSYEVVLPDSLVENLKGVFANKGE